MQRPPILPAALPAVLLLATACSAGASNETGPSGETASLCSPVTPTTAAAVPLPTVGENGRLVPAAASGLTPRELAALDDAFARAAVATGAPTLTAAVWQSGGRLWSAGIGDGRLHFWASVGKIVTAAAAIRLAESGHLDLEAPIDLPIGLPPADRPSPADLMAHLGGIDDGHAVEGDRDRSAFLAAMRPRTDCPAGYRWHYSNIGYAILGEAVAAAAGRPYAQAAQELVLGRSEARRLRLLPPDGDIADTVPPAAPVGQDPVDIRSTQGAGGLVGDAEAVAILLRDLLAGRIVEADRVAWMLDPLQPMGQPELFYGRGLMVYAVPEADGPRVWIGHSGGIPGARAVVAYDPALDAIAAVALTGDGSAEATAALLFRALDR